MTVAVSSCLLIGVMPTHRDSVTVGRNLWIGDIHGSACAIYGSILCAEIHGLRRYLWIAQGSCLRGPREIFAGPPAILSHTCLLCKFSCNISGQFALYVWSTIPHVSVRCEAEVRNNSNITAGTCLERACREDVPMPTVCDFVPWIVEAH